MLAPVVASRAGALMARSGLGLVPIGGSDADTVAPRRSMVAMERLSWEQVAVTACAAGDVRRCAYARPPLWRVHVVSRAGQSCADQPMVVDNCAGRGGRKFAADGEHLVASVSLSRFQTNRS